MVNLLINIWIVISVINIIFAFIVFQRDVDELAGEEYSGNLEYPYYWYKATIMMMYFILGVFPVIHVFTMIVYIVKLIKCFINND